MKRIPRCLFTEEFKREAIRFVTEHHLNVAAAGRQLDVAPKSIRSWIEEAEGGELKASLGASKLTADQQRIQELERELAIALEERDILKKPSRTLQNSRSKYAMIDKLNSQHSVQRLCQQLNVAMSGYLDHSHGRPDSERKQQDQRLLVYIRAAHARGRGI